MALVRKFKQRSYQVCVTILEAKHLQQNGNPVVVVRVGNRKRRTMVRERTDCPVYNEYFVFDFADNLDALLSTRITIAVYMRNCLRQLKFYSSILLDVATVWEQPDHQFYHKWAILTDPKNLTAGHKGYVKCNITVNVKGEKVRVHPETEGEDDIEGNLLLPLGGRILLFRQKARYVFSIYRADDLPDMSSFCGRADSENINAYIQISFAGMKGHTMVHHQTRAPNFNERIIFKEMFPSLCQRVRISIKHKIDACRSCTIATHIMSLSKISHSGEYGFPPTFGPSFVHFYASNSKLETNSCAGKHSRALPVYRGRVLLSLKTEMEEPEASPRTSVETEPSLAIIEESLWTKDEYLLVAILYDVCMIDRRRFMTKSISFEVSLGNDGSEQFSRNAKNSGPSIDWTELKSQTAPRMTATMDGKYNYLPIGSKMPCIYVKSWWPNVEWRMYNMNNLNYIANYLETQLEKVEALITVENVEAYRTYNELVLTLKTYCTRYLHILDGERCETMGGRTKLDRHRVNMCGKQIADILKRIEKNGQLPNNHYIRIAMIHAYQYLRKIRELLTDPQHGLPDIFIWLLSRSKRAAFVRLPAEEVIYSEIDTETGTKCGRRINVFMGGERAEYGSVGDYTACKIELFLWLGNAKFATACWTAIPPGYEDVYAAGSGADHENGHDTFPKYFEYERQATFQLRAHIFQGRFDPGMDASGLLDPIVRVIFRGHTATTRTIRQSLDPFWDQTLVFPPVTVHGTRESIKQSPPQVVLQVFDQDLCGTKEFCGLCTAIPIVKLIGETYSPPDFPPMLEWYKFKSQRDCAGSVLAAFELIEIREDGEEEVAMNPTDDDRIYSIPEDIRPKMASYRLETIFWGVRDMRKIGYMDVTRPRIVIDCAGVLVKSEVMENAKRFCNFDETHVITDLDMPELDIYYPSVTIKAYESRGFGCFKYAGVCIIPTVYVFLRQLITEQEYMRSVHETRSAQRQRQEKRQSAVFALPSDFDPSKEESKGLISYKRIEPNSMRRKCQKILRALKLKLSGCDLPFFGRKKMIYGDDDDETYDWWSKYFASLEEERKAELGIPSANPVGRKPVARLKIYSTELEMQPQFEGFQDRLTAFDLWKGKKSADPDEDGANFAGRFKGHISIYRWPHPDKVGCKTKRGRDAANGLCDDYPPQEPVKLLVRVYVVKGINLHPKDPMSGKSDPYLWIKLGKTIINDRSNYIPNQLNPTFGRFFEIDATLPQDYTLTIQVWDYDAASSDDLIGETKIDIENRFYSRHRACCGIARTYSTSGYNAWRDRERPKQILEFLCRKNNLPLPQYTENDVRIGKRKFPFNAIVESDEDGADREECMALSVLHQWEDFPVCGCALVPEHLERRPLYNSRRTGLEQGRLELWIDMFQFGQLPPRPAVDIAPQPPVEYEIRAIVWNTEDVPLVESQFLTGERCSDIYVKGWILYEDYQKTDVHYNSLTGEGNFNWRFVFRVTYSRGEHVMVVRQKASILARNETEQKLPCRLHLQVWDNDHYTPDDFLGALTLDLARLPRGSGSSKTCNLRILDPHLPTMNLFKVSRTKGWWPFTRFDSAGNCELAGKVELELSALPATEANECPAGKGRDPPQDLPPPNRPETSFSWFRNPWKACRFVVCRYYKWRIICCLLIVLLALLAACGIYAFPGYLVKRILGA